MKFIVHFCFTIVFFGCISVNTGSDPVQLAQKRTYILVQLDSFSSLDKKLFFTPIQAYTSILFRPIEIVENTEIKDVKESDFYVKMLLNGFNEGILENTSVQLKNKNRKELYLLEVNILESDKNKLVIQNIIKPNTVNISSLVILE